MIHENPEGKNLTNRPEPKLCQSECISRINEEVDLFNANDNIGDTKNFDSGVLRIFSNNNAFSQRSSELFRKKP